MEVAEGPRCSDAARERGDPLLATAPSDRRLLLVEVRGPWGPAGLTATRRLDAGRLSLGFYRGRVGRAPVVQAALHLAVVWHCGQRYVIRFEEWWAEPEYLSCSAPVAKPARRFILRSFDGQREVWHAG